MGIIRIGNTRDRIIKRSERIKELRDREYLKVLEKEEHDLKKRAREARAKARREFIERKKQQYRNIRDKNSRFLPNYRGLLKRGK